MTSLPFTKGTNPGFERPVVFTVNGNNLGQSLDMKILRVKQDQEAEIITQVEVPIRDMLTHAPSDMLRSLQLFQSPLWKDNRDFCISYTFFQNAVMPGTQLAHVWGRAQGLELMPGLGRGLMMGQGSGSGQMVGQGGGLMLRQGAGQMLDQGGGSGQMQGHGPRYQPQVPGYQPQHEENHPLLQQGPRPRPRPRPRRRRNWFRSIRRELRALVAEIDAILFCRNEIEDVVGSDEEDGIEA